MQFIEGFNYLEPIKGKIFNANIKNVYCECKKKIKLQEFITNEDNKKFKTILGFCDCGNIIIGHKPVEMF